MNRVPHVRYCKVGVKFGCRGKVVMYIQSTRTLHDSQQNRSHRHYAGHLADCRAANIVPGSPDMPGGRPSWWMELIPRGNIIWRSVPVADGAASD